MPVTSLPDATLSEQEIRALLSTELTLAQSKAFHHLSEKFLGAHCHCSWLLLLRGQRAPTTIRFSLVKKGGNEVASLWVRSVVLTGYCETKTMMESESVVNNDGILFDRERKQGGHLFICEKCGSDVLLK